MKGFIFCAIMHIIKEDDMQYKIPGTQDQCADYIWEEMENVFKKLKVSWNNEIYEPTSESDITGRPKLSRGRPSFASVEAFKAYFDQQRQVMCISIAMLNKGFKWHEISAFVGGYNFMTLHKWAFEHFKIKLVK